MVADFPKINSPFVRKAIGNDYIVTSEIPNDMKWVFEDDGVLATEKLHGTNVSIVIENGTITSVWNRTERIPFFNKGKIHIIQGVLEAYERGYCELPDGQYFGECIGPKINGNPYNLNCHVWIPFDYVKQHLVYKSFYKYPKTFEGWNEWFKELQPLYCWRLHGKEWCDKNSSLCFVEGIVFHHSDGRMAKLRKDMFDWFKGVRHNEG